MVGQSLQRASMPSYWHQPGAVKRWPLVYSAAVTHVRAQPAASTKRALAIAQLRLGRYGVVTREIATAEAIPGGFKSIYPVLKRLDEGGRIQRGYFLDGLSGAQFAAPGVIDRLRSQDRGAQAVHGWCSVMVTCLGISPPGRVLC